MAAEKEIYLLSMNFKGIKNIEKTIGLKFYKDTVTKNFNRNGFNIKGIYGENGVGKSAIITAANIFRELLLNPRFLNNGLSNKKLSYLVNKGTESSSFEFEYLIKDENIYIYKIKFEIKKNENNLYEIIYESVYKKTVNGKYLLLYEVNDGVLNYHGPKNFTTFVIDNTKNVLKNSSLIGYLSNVKTEEKYKNNYDDLKRIYYCGAYTYVYFDEKDDHDDYVLNKFIVDNRERINRNVSFMRPISFIRCSKPLEVSENLINEYENQVKMLSDFIKIFKPDLLDIKINKKPIKDGYSCDIEFVYKNYKIAGEFESSGIKKLVELYSAFDVISHGGIVFIDELDANIHDYYLCKLLEYVGEYTKGQLCFTTHNLGPMRVLRDYKKSIDFLSRDGDIVSWIKNGNYDVSSLYKHGKIEKSPFNIESFDFISVFGEQA